MATVGQIHYNVLNPTPDGNKLELLRSEGLSSIYSNIIPQVISGGGKFTKVGIQARPGTKVVIGGGDGDEKTIVIGASGTYEIDDVRIGTLYFEKPPKYEFDPDATGEAIIAGAKAMKKAEEDREKALKELGDKPSNDAPAEEQEEYWTKFDKIESDFEKAYKSAEALTKFYKGKNGVYSLPYPDDPNNTRNFDDLYNVIVDYIYE